MSFFSINTNLFYDKDYLSKSNFFEEENSSIPLDNSFSLMISEENKNKNPLENIESQFQIINNSKNSEMILLLLRLLEHRKAKFKMT